MQEVPRLCPEPAAGTTLQPRAWQLQEQSCAPDLPLEPLMFAWTVQEGWICPFSARSVLHLTQCPCVCSLAGAAGQEPRASFGSRSPCAPRHQNSFIVTDSRQTSGTTRESKGTTLICEALLPHQTPNLCVPLMQGSFHRHPLK